MSSAILAISSAPILFICALHSFFLPNSHSFLLSVSQVLRMFTLFSEILLITLICIALVFQVVFFCTICYNESGCRFIYSSLSFISNAPYVVRIPCQSCCCYLLSLTSFSTLPYAEITMTRYLYLISCWITCPTTTRLNLIGFLMLS